TTELSSFSFLRCLPSLDLRPDSLEGLVHSKDRGMAASTQESATDGIPTTPLGPASHGSGGASLQPPDTKLPASTWTPRRSKPGMAASCMESATGK
ncbi:hypothetical protein CVT26_007396, partial [Gymnopilus dilepis]